MHMHIAMVCHTRAIPTLGIFSKACANGRVGHVRGAPRTPTSAFADPPIPLTEEVNLATVGQY